MEKYTTAEKKASDLLLPKEEWTEQDKTVISPEAYAICDFIEILIKKIEHARISLIK